MVDSSSNKNPMVSVLCPTYNHIEYIKQTLDGFLMQEVDFDFEILINDDASTDGTVEFLREYRDAYPDIIKLNLQEENQYSKGFRGNIMRILLPIATGKYIATCEGDDFWISPHKLKKQVDFLEANEDYSICFHPTQVLFSNEDLKSNSALAQMQFCEDDPGRPVIFPQQKTGFTVFQLIHRNFIHTCSAMYRRLPDYNLTNKDIMPLDWYLHLYHAQYGKIAFIDEIMASYRVHDSGIWESLAVKDKELFVQRFGIPILRFHMIIREMFGHGSETDNEHNSKQYELVCEQLVFQHLISLLMANGGDYLGDEKSDSQKFVVDLFKNACLPEDDLDIWFELIAMLGGYAARRNYELNKVVNEFRESTSWKITFPLRKISGLLKQLIN